MALPEFTRRQVDSKLETFCSQRIPPHASHQVRLTHRVRGNNVTVIEQRASFFEQGEWVDIPIGQFRFDSETALWHLYWPDRNGRWHEVLDYSPARDFDVALDFLANDASGAFWG